MNRLWSRRVLSGGEKPEIMALCDIPRIITYNKTPANKRVLMVCSLFLAVILYPAVHSLFLGLLGFTVSYQLYYVFGAAKTGGKAWGMLIWHGIHLHHWLYCLLLLIVYFYTLCVYNMAINKLITGLLFGGITHGIQFSDWNIIIR